MMAFQSSAYPPVILLKNDISQYSRLERSLTCVFLFEAAELAFSYYLLILANSVSNSFNYLTIARRKGVNTRTRLLFKTNSANLPERKYFHRSTRA